MLIFITLILINSVYALGVSPAKIEGNFKPGMETSIEYSINSNLNRYLEVYARGDLADYITFDESKIFKSGKVTATLKLPDEIEPPGPQKTYIGVRELADEELAGGMGTAIGIEALILIHVPYPGKYLESNLKAKSVNLGEPVEFELEVISRGKDEVIMKPLIEVYSEHDELIETLEFREREIKTQETIKLIKEMNTTSCLSGDYYAISKISYGERMAESRVEFKIGELKIDIVNYTKQILLGGIKNFWIEIESGWNDRIDGAYAEIVILNGSKKITEFKTSPTDLSPWENRIITGYIDTKDILPGIYNADITLIYYGRDRGESTNEIVPIEFIEQEKINWLLIVGVVIGIIFIAIFFIYIIRKNGKNK